MHSRMNFLTSRINLLHHIVICVTTDIENTYGGSWSEQEVVSIPESMSALR